MADVGDIEGRPVRLEITLTGDVSVGRDPDGERQPVTGPARVVLAALVLERSTGLSRDALAGIVWPEAMPATWASALRTHVSRARTALARAGGLSGEVVASVGDGYQLALPPGIEAVVDIEHAERLIERARRARPNDAAAAVRLASTAADLVRPPFLRGHPGPWADDVRHRLDDLAIDALLAVSDAATATGDGRTAVAAADEAIHRAPLRERSHRQLMAALVADGDRAAALRAYQRLRRLLADELGVDPSPDTERAYLDLLGPSPAPRRDPERAGAMQGSAAPAATPFVGRDRELAVLAEAWEQAASGGRHVVVISGEAGIGKSRLASEAARQVAPDGGLVLVGRCDEEAIVPYQPITEALDAVVSAMPDEGLPDLGPEAAADLASLLPSLPAPALARTAPDRGRLFAAVTDILASLARDRPVLLVLDDLQWADDDTLLLVRHLLRRAGDAPILVVAITRDHDLGPGHALGEVVHALDRDGWVRRLPLRALGEDDVRTLLDHLGRTASPDRDARRLVAETAGNPFLLTELVRAAPDGAGQPGGDGGDGEAIPAGVHDLVASRLGRLPRPTVELLRAAAIAGARFDLEVAGAAAGLEGDEMLDAADAALGSGLVIEETADRYRFPHDIVRRTIETRLSGIRRRTLHRRTADAIEQRHAHDLDPPAAVLAHHTAAGADPGGDRRAVDWARRAAVDAAGRSAPAEVVRLRRQALAHVPPADAELRAEVTVEVGQAELAAGDAASARTLADGAAQARQLGRTDLLAEAALALADAAAADHGRRATGRALVDAALADLVPSDDDARVVTARLCVRRLRLGGTLPEPLTGDRLPPLVDALHDLVLAASGPADLDRRRCLADELAVLADAADDSRYRVVAAHHAAMVAAEAGDEPGLDKALAALADEAARGSDPVAAALLDQRAVADRVAEGRLDGVRDVLDRAVASARAAGSAAGRDHPGHRLVDPPEQIEARHGVIVAWMTGDDPPPPVAGPGGDLHALAVAALAAVATGDPVAVAAARSDLAPYAHRMCCAGYLSFAGAAGFHLGRLAASVDDWSEAERHLQSALRHHSSVHARGWVALTQRALAGVLAGRGRLSDRDWIDALRAEADHVTATLGLRSD